MPTEGDPLQPRHCECVLRGRGGPLNTCKRCGGTGELRPASVRPPPCVPVPTPEPADRKKPRGGERSMMKTTPPFHSERKTCPTCSRAIPLSRFRKHIRSHVPAPLPEPVVTCAICKVTRNTSAMQNHQCAPVGKKPKRPAQPAPSPRIPVEPKRPHVIPEVFIVRAGTPRTNRKGKARNKGKRVETRAAAPVAGDTMERCDSVEPLETVLEPRRIEGTEATREYHNADLRQRDGRFDSTPLHDDHDDESSP